MLSVNDFRIGMTKVPVYSFTQIENGPLLVDVIRPRKVYVTPVLVNGKKTLRLFTDIDDENYEQIDNPENNDITHWFSNTLDELEDYFNTQMMYMRFVMEEYYEGTIEQKMEQMEAIQLEIEQLKEKKKQLAELPIFVEGWV